MLSLRPRQNECLDAILTAYVEGLRQLLVVKATGTGKAVVIANIQKKVQHLLNGKVLVFAHREELVDQLIDTYRAWNPEKKIGKEMADDRADDDCNVVVSCVASIGRNGSQRLIRFGQFDIVICDEAHHSIAQTYLNVFESTGVLRAGTKTLLVGFTATPKRHNRKRTSTQVLLDDEKVISLKSVYQKNVFTYPIRKAIKEGWLVPLRGYRVKTTTDLDSVKVVAGDFQQDQLQNAVNNPDRNALVLKAWLKYGEGRQTVGFSSGINHARDLADLFRRNGVRAEAVWGNDPERHDFAKCNGCGAYASTTAHGDVHKRDKDKQPCGGTFLYGKGKLERHRAKDITVLFNDSVLTEGYDDWQVSCIIMAAPTGNDSKYTQEVGRGTRLQEGAGNLLEALKAGYALSKQDCLVLDLADNSKRCSLVTLPSLLGLNPEMDLGGASVTAVADKMEELQEQYPTVSLTPITDISKVEAYLESIDLLAEPYDEDVKQLSQFTWISATDGSYLLAIPEKKELKGLYAQYLHEKLHIKQNDLDEYELSISTAKDQERKLATCNTLKEAFETADDVIRRCRADRLKLLQREGEWRHEPASEAVKKYLRSLTKKKPLLKCICSGYAILGTQCKSCKLQPITAGEASTAIEILKSRRK